MSTLKPIRIGYRLMLFSFTGGLFSNNNTAAIVKKIAEMMFSGVSFIFNFLSFTLLLYYFLFLNFLDFQEGILFFIFSLSEAAIAAACFFSWKAPLKSGSSLRF